MANHTKNHTTPEELDFYSSVRYDNSNKYTAAVVSKNISTEEIRNKDILDYGCGTGDASFYFEDSMPASVTGIDIGESNINYANKKKIQGGGKFENLNFIKADLNSHNLELKKYDLIWSDTTISFLKKPLSELMYEFKMSLRSGGVLYISFTKDNFSNTAVYCVIKFLRQLCPKKCGLAFYYLALTRYYVYRIFDKSVEINHQEIKNKLNYAFVPHIRLISIKQILQLMKINGFEICYVRKRVKSDVNSPAHLEIKAVKKKRNHT